MEWFTPRQAAALVGVVSETFRNWRTLGYIPDCGVLKKRGDDGEVFLNPYWVYSRDDVLMLSLVRIISELGVLKADAAALAAVLAPVVRAELLGEPHDAAPYVLVYAKVDALRPFPFARAGQEEPRVGAVFLDDLSGTRLWSRCGGLLIHVSGLTEAVPAPVAELFREEAI